MAPDPDRPGAFYLRVDDSDQSHVDTGDPFRLEFDYVRHLSYILDSLPEGPLRVLHLGAGALTLPRYVAASRPGSYQQAVDIDAELIALVREVAPLPKKVKVKVRIGDAREQLTAAPDDCYDVIIVDVYAGHITPAHLTTREFFGECARVLRPGGAVLFNAGDGGEQRYARSIVATLGEFFAHRCLLAGSTVLRGRRFGNLVVGASTVPFDERAIARRAAGDVFPTGFMGEAEAARYAKGARVNVDGDAVASQAPPGLLEIRRRTRGAARP